MDWHLLVAVGILIFTVDIVHQVIMANRMLYHVQEQHREMIALLQTLNESTRRVEHAVRALESTQEEAR